VHAASTAEEKDVPTTDDDRAQKALAHEECLRLLADAVVGRLVYTRDALPAIRPVPFVLSRDDVVIPVRQGSPLLDAVRNAVVAFETDRYDPAARTCWSVTVVGPSRVLAGPVSPITAEGAPPELRLIAVRVQLVEGWRTTLPYQPIRA
jgi:uncharacterized protein